MIRDHAERVWVNGAWIATRWIHRWQIGRLYIRQAAAYARARLATNSRRTRSGSPQSGWGAAARVHSLRQLAAEQSTSLAAGMASRGIIDDDHIVDNEIARIRQNVEFAQMIPIDAVRKKRLAELRQELNVQVELSLMVSPSDRAWTQSMLHALSIHFGDVATDIGSKEDIFDVVTSLGWRREFEPLYLAFVGDGIDSEGRPIRLYETCIARFIQRMAEMPLPARYWIRAKQIVSELDSPTLRGDPEEAAALRPQGVNLVAKAMENPAIDRLLKDGPKRLTSEELFRALPWPQDGDYKEFIGPYGGTFIVEFRNNVMTFHIQTMDYSPTYTIVYDNHKSFTYLRDKKPLAFVARGIEQPFSWDGETVDIIYPNEIEDSFSWNDLLSVLQGPLAGLRIRLISKQFADEYPLDDFQEGRSSFQKGSLLEAAKEGMMPKAMDFLRTVIFGGKTARLYTFLERVRSPFELERGQLIISLRRENPQDVNCTTF